MSKTSGLQVNSHAATLPPKVKRQVCEHYDTPLTLGV